MSEEDEGDKKLPGEEEIDTPDTGVDDGDAEKERDTELLSKEEIDTLLTGVDDGDVEIERSVNDGIAVPFDFKKQDQIVRGRMPTLEMLNERFARFFRTTLSEMLQRNCGVTASNIEVQKYSEYAGDLYVPASLNWVEFAPLYGRGLITLDATLVFKLVDLFFGGNGQNVKVDTREFTMTEQRIVNRVINGSFADIKQAWQSVVDFALQLKSHESNPLLTNMMAPSESVIVSRFEVDLDGEAGQFHIVLPISMVEPIKDTLGAGLKTDVDSSDEQWGDELRRELMYASIDLNCKVVERQISLRDILDLEEGDVIPVDLPEHVSVLANDRLIYSAKLGVSGDRMALEIHQQVSADD